MNEIAKPKGKIADDVLQYIAEMCGSTIEHTVDGKTLIKSIKLGYYEFSSTTNRYLVEQIARHVSLLPNPNVEVPIEVQT